MTDPKAAYNDAESALQAAKDTQNLPDLLAAAKVAEAILQDRQTELGRFLEDKKNVEKGLENLRRQLNLKEAEVEQKIKDKELSVQLCDISRKFRPIYREWFNELINKTKGAWFWKDQPYKTSNEKVHYSQLYDEAKRGNWCDPNAINMNYKKRSTLGIMNIEFTRISEVYPGGNPNLNDQSDKFLTDSEDKFEHIYKDLCGSRSSREHWSTWTFFSPDQNGFYHQEKLGPRDNECLHAMGVVISLLDWGYSLNDYWTLYQFGYAGWRIRPKGPTDFEAFRASPNDMVRWCAAPGCSMPGDPVTIPKLEDLEVDPDRVREKEKAEKDLTTAQEERDSLAKDVRKKEGELAQVTARYDARKTYLDHPEPLLQAATGFLEGVKASRKQKLKRLAETRAIVEAAEEKLRLKALAVAEAEERHASAKAVAGMAEPLAQTLESEVRQLDVARANLERRKAKLDAARAEQEKRRGQAGAEEDFPVAPTRLRGILWEALAAIQNYSTDLETCGNKADAWLKLGWDAGRFAFFDQAVDASARAAKRLSIAQQRGEVARAIAQAAQAIPPLRTQIDQIKSRLEALQNELNESALFREVPKADRLSSIADLERRLETVKHAILRVQVDVKLARVAFDSAKKAVGQDYTGWMAEDRKRLPECLANAKTSQDKAKADEPRVARSTDVKEILDCLSVAREALKQLDSALTIASALDGKLIRIKQVSGDAITAKQQVDRLTGLGKEIEECGKLEADARNLTEGNKTAEKAAQAVAAKLRVLRGKIAAVVWVCDELTGPHSALSEACARLTNLEHCYTTLPELGPPLEFKPVKFESDAVGPKTGRSAALARVATAERLRRQIQEWRADLAVCFPEYAKKLEGLRLDVCRKRREAEALKFVERKRAQSAAPPAPQLVVNPERFPARLGQLTIEFEFQRQPSAAPASLMDASEGRPRYIDLSAKDRTLTATLTSTPGSCTVSAEIPDRAHIALRWSAGDVFQMFVEGNLVATGDAQASIAIGAGKAEDVYPAIRFLREVKSADGQLQYSIRSLRIWNCLRPPAAMVRDLDTILDGRERWLLIVDPSGGDAPAEYTRAITEASQPKPLPVSCPEETILLYSSSRQELLRPGDRVTDLDWEPEGLLVGVGIAARLYSGTNFTGERREVCAHTEVLKDTLTKGKIRSLEAEAIPDRIASAQWIATLSGGQIIGAGIFADAPLTVQDFTGDRSLLHLRPIASVDGTRFTATLQSVWNHRFLDLRGTVPRFVIYETKLNVRSGPEPPSGPYANWAGDGSVYLYNVEDRLNAPELHLRLVIQMGASSPDLLLTAGTFAHGFRLYMRDRRIVACFYGPPPARQDYEEKAISEPLVSGTSQVDLRCVWSKERDGIRKPTIIRLAAVPASGPTDPVPSDSKKRATCVNSLQIWTGDNLPEQPAVPPAASWSMPAPQPAEPSHPASTPTHSFSNATLTVNKRGGLTAIADGAQWPSDQWTLSGRFLVDVHNVPKDAITMLALRGVELRLLSDGTLRLGDACLKLDVKDSEFQAAIVCNPDATLTLHLDQRHGGDHASAATGLKFTGKPNPLRLGGQPADAGEFLICDLAVWPRALSATELIELRDAPPGGYNGVQRCTAISYWNFDEQSGRITRDGGKQGCDFVAAANPTENTPPTPDRKPQCWDQLFKAWSNTAIEPVSSNSATIPEVTVELDSAMDLFSLRGAGGYLAFDPTAADFYLTGSAQAACKMRLAARVAASEGAMDRPLPGQVVLCQDKENRDRVYTLAASVTAEQLKLEPEPASSVRDDAEWERALADAQARDPHLNATAGLDKARRIAALWRLMPLFFDDLQNGWAVAAGRAGIEFPEREFIATLEQWLQPASSGNQRRALEFPASGATATIGIPLVRKHWTAAQEDFWVNGKCHRLKIRFDICPSAVTDGKQHIILAREGCFRIGIEGASAPAVVAQFWDGKDPHIVRSVPVQPGQWSFVAIDWDSGDDPNTSNLAISISDGPAQKTAVGNSPLSAGTGPLLIGTDPARSEPGYVGSIRRIRIGNGSSIFGEWPLDDGPGRHLEDTSRMHLFGAADGTQPVVSTALLHSS